MRQCLDAHSRRVSAKNVVHEVGQCGACVLHGAVDVDKVAAVVHVCVLFHVAAHEVVEGSGAPQRIKVADEDDPHFGQLLVVFAFGQLLVVFAFGQQAGVQHAGVVAQALCAGAARVKLHFYVVARAVFISGKYVQPHGVPAQVGEQFFGAHFADEQIRLVHHDAQQQLRAFFVLPKEQLGQDAVGQPQVLDAFQDLLPAQVVTVAGGRGHGSEEGMMKTILFLIKINCQHLLPAAAYIPN